MSTCTRCQTPYESGARFCQQCGAALPEAEPVSSSPAADLEAPPTAASQVSQGPSPKVSPRLLAIFGGAAIIILIAAIFLFMGNGSPPPKQGPAATTEAISPEVGLPQHLAQILGTLREAQVSKDITRFMNCYAAQFPGREEKRLQTLKAWTEFDFTAMFFYLDEVKPAGPEAAQAKVTWDLQVQDKRTQEFLTSTQAFQVEFVKEQGAWRIRSLQEIQTP